MPVILQEERPWRAPTHGSTHVSTGHVAEGGTSIACTMTRGSWRWERHIAPKTHRLMRALQQRQGEAAPTEGAAAEQQQQNPARDVMAEPGDCTETPLVGPQSRENGTPRASSRPTDRFPAFPTTTHPAFPTRPWQLDT